jgi:hypothetical protein
VDLISSKNSDKNQNQSLRTFQLQSIHEHDSSNAASILEVGTGIFAVDLSLRGTVESPDKPHASQIHALEAGLNLLSTRALQRQRKTVQ